MNESGCMIEGVKDCTKRLQDDPENPCKAALIFNSGLPQLHSPFLVPALVFTTFLHHVGMPS